MVEMRVAGIALDAASRSPIVLLRDPSGRRQVPIWIDQAQAQNILAGLNQVKPPRPLSHDLMVALMEAGQLRLERVIIHAIEDSTFRAVLKLQTADGESLEIDARPSDAIALALRCDTTIWMLEEVVSNASIPVDAEADAEDQEDFRRFLDRTSPAELIRHLGRAMPEQTHGEHPAPAEGPPETPETPAEADDTEPRAEPGAEDDDAPAGGGPAAGGPPGS
ncbi:MAG: bifunctional nuclease family protein [Synechococcaceae cyanobacterium]|nr:bifunctional nuclease family protein [Synechococcaceae cyanobacterium]